LLDLGQGIAMEYDPATQDCTLYNTPQTPVVDLTRDETVAVLVAA
jgi:hypothetical protein